MIKFFLILVVICAGIGFAAYWRLSSGVEKEIKEEPRAAAVQEVERKEDVKALVPGIRLIPSDVNSPVLETSEGSYRPGNLVASGQVKQVRGGIAEVEWDGRTTFDVTTQSQTSTEIAHVVGRVWTDAGIESVMLRDGDVLRVGRMSRRGRVEKLSEERADLRRQDGGWLFVVFSSVVRDEDKEKFLVTTAESPDRKKGASLLDIGRQGPSVTPPENFP